MLQISMTMEMAENLTFGVQETVDDLNKPNLNGKL